MPPVVPVPGECETKPVAQPSNQEASTQDLAETLKRQLHETRLPAGWKEQYLAELPPPEERERQLRELMAQGGLSFEEFFESYQCC